MMEIDYRSLDEFINSFYDKPESSLCDNCKYAFIITGGYVSYVKDDRTRTYQQRYCYYSEKGTITDKGYQECELFESNDK